MPTPVHGPAVAMIGRYPYAVTYFTTLSAAETYAGTVWGGLVRETTPGQVWRVAVLLRPSVTYTVEPESVAGLVTGENRQHTLLDDRGHVLVRGTVVQCDAVRRAAQQQVQERRTA